MAWAGGAFGLGTVALAYVPFCIYLLGSCWLFYFIADDVKSDLTAFNIDVNAIEAAATADAPHVGTRSELLSQFCAVVQIYTDAKQKEVDIASECSLICCRHCLHCFLLFHRSVKEFNQIYKYLLFAFYVWVMLLLSSSLVAMQFQLVEYMKLKDSNSKIFGKRHKNANAKKFLLLLVVGRQLESD